MTAETEVSEVCKGEIVEACDSDMSSYEDLQKCGGECNGVSHDSGEGVIGNGKADSDCSYVFVSGRDDGYAEKDLNVEPFREADQHKDEEQVQAGELRIQNGENDQLHEAADCSDVEGTVSSSSNNTYVQVESTGALVVGGGLLLEPNLEVDVESEPPQPNVVITEEQTSLGSVAEEQTDIGCGAERQTDLESGTEERSGLGGGTEEQTGLEPGTEEQTGLEPGTEEKTRVESGTKGQTGLGYGAGAEEQSGFELSAATEKQTGLDPSTEEQTGLEYGAGVEEQTGLESGGGTDKQKCLESGPGVEEQTGSEPGGGAEEQTGPDSGAGTQQQTGSEPGGGSEEQTGPDSGAGTQQQTGLGLGEEQQTGLGLGEEQQTGLGLGEEQQTGLGLGEEQQTGLGLGEEQQTSLGPGEEERTGLGPGREELAGLGPGKEEPTGLGPGEEEPIGLGSNEGEQTGLGSGEGKCTGLASGEEQTSCGSGEEEQTSFGYIVEPTGEQTVAASASEETEPNIILLGKEQSQVEVSQAVALELMQSENENPKVDGHINFKPSEEIAGSGDGLVPVLETECKLLHAEDRGEKDDEQNTVESKEEATENQDSEVVITNSDECDLHQLNNEAEKVQEESESDSETVANESQESEIKVSKDLSFDGDGEKPASELENGLASEGPSVEFDLSLEHNLKIPSPGINIKPEAEIAVGSVLDENGDGLPIGCISSVCGSSDTEAANVCHQGASELYAPSENDRSLSSCCDHVRSESIVGSVPAENEESLPTGLENSPLMVQEEYGASVITEDFPISAADAVKQETAIGSSGPINGEKAVSCPDDGTKSERKDEAGLDEDSTLACSGTDVRSETIICFGSIKFPCGDGNVESHASKVTPKCSSSKPVNVDIQGILAPELKDLVENGSDLPTSADAEIDDISYKDVASSNEIRDGSVVDIVGNDVDVKIEGDQISARVVNDENEGDQITCVESDDKLTCQEAGSVLGNDISSSLEVSGPDVLDSQIVPTEVGKRPFNFLIRVPRYDDEKIREEIKHAQLEVDEKTKSRDAIRSEIQMKRAVCKEYNEKFEVALSEERAARELLKSKFQEIDSVQSVINRMKNAMSVKDIDSRIRNMEHTIEHETLPLKEEKQLIRDIKQLRNVREQLSSNMGRQEEVQQALDQKSQVEEQSKTLREEMDSLRNKVQKFEVTTKAAKKKYYEENEKLNELLARFKAADDIRQEAYAHLQSLRKKLSEKNKYFRMYRDDLKAANDYATAGDKEALQQLCVNEVETIMELWNNNDEFRKEYVRCNTRSTLRRLRTLDGRSLGPDEEPPVLPYSLNDIGRSHYALTKDSSVPTAPVEQEKKRVPAEAERAEDKSTVKNQTGRNKNDMKPASGAVSATISGRDEEIETTRKDERQPTKEEEELMRRAEEMRKEEQAAKLKELRRLEEKAKAKEALERKKRNAEKAQARAELRAQKEAEQKQREREKKAQKRERKKAFSAEGVNGRFEAESPQSLETPSESAQDSESTEKPGAIRKTAHKAPQFTKQTKSKSIAQPPPIRNRGRRRIQSWMWALAIALLVLALFLLGNSGLSATRGLQSFGF